MRVKLVGMCPELLDDTGGWDEAWGIAHDPDVFDMDRAVEAHNPGWNWVHEDHIERLEILAERHLYTPWEWSESLGPGHEVIPYSVLPARCITSSIAYLMALALHFEAEKIGIYGVSLDAGEEYTHQRAGLHYLIGRADERGVEVVIHPDSGLLDRNPYGQG